MSYDFYNSKEYREKQSEIMKENWSKGVFNFLLKREKRICVRKGCGRTFEVIFSNPKIYCCRSCAGKVNNVGRGPLSEETKIKIAESLKGTKSPFKGIIKVPRVHLIWDHKTIPQIFIYQITILISRLKIFFGNIQKLGIENLENFIRI